MRSLGTMLLYLKDVRLEKLRGAKKGNPTIKDNVTIYANATVCGNIVVEKNSEICAGAFVNFDVPENSVVIGNPGVIHERKRE